MLLIDCARIFTPMKQNGRMNLYQASHNCFVRNKFASLHQFSCCNAFRSFSTTRSRQKQSFYYRAKEKHRRVFLSTERRGEDGGKNGAKLPSSVIPYFSSRFHFISYQFLDALLERSWTNTRFIPLRLFRIAITTAGKYPLSLVERRR